MDNIRRAVTTTLMYVFLFSTHGIHVNDANKTYYEDVYDCVDFYKQPAFDHPLLANHTFHPEMRPSSTSKDVISKTKLSRDMKFHFKTINCPIGTIPIRRITTEDRRRERLHSEKIGSQYKVFTTETPGTHYATARTKWKPTQKYYGARAKLSVWNPSVQSSQYSSSQTVLRSGHENIQVGWTVNPTLYGDDRTRVFIYTSTDFAQCFNTRCPGFVQVHKDISVDHLLEPISEIGGPIYFVVYMISKDANDGNWWLTFGSDTWIGFWPKNIFTNLVDTATSVEWGGQVYSPPDVPSPPMGTGSFLTSDIDYQSNACCGFVETIKEAYEIVDALDLDAYSDSSFYEIRKAGNIGGRYGNLIEFGGPGGATGN